jgi:hypothetical protein
MARTYGNGSSEMRVLSSYASRGDVDPMVGLAVRLRALGAEGFDALAGVLSPLAVEAGIDRDFVYATAGGVNVFTVKAVDRAGNTSEASNADGGLLRSGVLDRMLQRRPPAANVLAPAAPSTAGSQGADRRVRRNRHARCIVLPVLHCGPCRRRQGREE